MEVFVKNIYWPKKGKPLPFELGILCSINSMRSLLAEFKEEGYEYLITARLNQVYTVRFNKHENSMSSLISHV